MRQVLVAVTSDGREASETAAFINKAVVAGGAVVIQSLHQVPLGHRYIFVSNSREYALGVFDSRAKEVLKNYLAAVRKGEASARFSRRVYYSPERDNI